ncbi:MAG TPA: efflux RND transporter permease subunit [Tissierellaceae bacterium]|nr:efflux RND transporter permease subunit [Tissierellaceae bacterium]
MLSKFSVKKPYTVVVAVVIVLILGVISFMNLKTDLLPSLDLPYLVVMTNSPGSSPEEIELSITRPIEQVVATTNNVKNIDSISSENTSMVIMEFENDVNMDSATIEINSGLDLIKDNWDDTVSSPMIIKINPDMLPVMISAVDMEGMDVFETSKLTEEDIIPELESVAGVASVEGIGLLEENIEVTINPEKIGKLNKNILNRVDSELAEAEEELLNAKKEIKEGKDKIDQEEKTQLEQIGEGEKALSQGREEIAKGETEIEKGLEELNENKEKIKTGLEILELQEKGLAMAEEIPLPDLESMGEEGKEFIERIENSLKDGKGEVSEQKSELQNALQFIEGEIEEIDKGKAELEKQKATINSKEQELAQGKVLLNSEMDKAREELNSGEKEIDKKLDELEGAKDKAFEEASLDGVVSVDMISGILTAQNFDMPAGYIEEKGMDYLVKVGDEIDSIEEMEELLLFDTGEEAVGKVRLKDVTDIENIDNSNETYAKINGNNGVVLNFQKQSNFSTAEVAKNIRHKMDELSKEDSNLSFTNLMDQGIYIDVVVESVLQNIVFGGILAILILIVFLRDIKPTFVIAVSIPISIIFAIAMMYFTDVTINIISLAGLALGVGMLVDNSIVVIENIYRLRSQGVSAMNAAMEGAKEVSGAIIASTITTACVFLPIVFTEGMSRQIFADMGLTIAYALFASLIVALTLVPTMASKTLENTKENRSKFFDKLVEVYESTLQWSLNHKGIILTGAVLLLIISGYFAYSMGTSLIPEMEEPQMSLSLEMPEDSTFEETTEMSDKVMYDILDMEGIESVGGLQGGTMEGFGSTDNDNIISMYLILDEEKSISNNDIEQEIEDLSKDIEADILVDSSNMDMTALGGSGIEILVKGRDLDKLKDIGEEVSQIVEDTEGTIDVLVDVEDGPDETRLTVDKEKAMENGLTIAQVYQEISSILDEGKTSTTLTVENKDYPVIVAHGEKEDITRDNLKDVVIESDDGDEVVLGDIVNMSEATGLSSINRQSQERYISIISEIDSDYNIGLVSRELEGKLDDYDIEEGYHIEVSGENETIKKSLEDLIKMLLLAIALIYLIMVAQFQSLLSPFIVMFTIPLAFTGGLLALAITGNNISLISMLGFLVLSGVVVNNGIVFVDYTNQLIDKGMDKREALITTGKTRIRPILMTAMTTILGLSTLALGVGVGSEMLQPLAIVAIGGLIYATLLTLVVVPAMYDLLHK